MKSLGVIFARATSKRLPRKNLRPLNGAPLVAYMCRAALASRIGRVVVSTEDDEIAAIAERFGVAAPFRRPEALAADYAESPAILLHALDAVVAQGDGGYDVVVTLQPTTPFVLPRHIDACLEALEDHPEVNCCFTARRTAESPQWMFALDGGGVAKPFLGKPIEGEAEHSQRLPVTYFPTGAAYAVRVEALRRTNRVFADPLRIAEMEPERSVDIDDELDWLFAEEVARRYGFSLIPAEKARP